MKGLTLISLFTINALAHPSGLVGNYLLNFPWDLNSIAFSGGAPIPAILVRKIPTTNVSSRKRLGLTGLSWQMGIIGPLRVSTLLASRPETSAGLRV